MSNDQANYAVNEVTYSFRQKDGVKRPSLTLNVVQLTALGVIAALQSGDEKTVEYITDLVNGAQTSYLKSFVDSDIEFNQEAYEKIADQLTLEVIANLPRAERNVVGKDDLQAFAKDYIAIMPEITGKEKVRIETAASLFVEKFKRVAGKKDALAVLKEGLETFAEKAPEQMQEDHARTLMYLLGKVEELMGVDIDAGAL